MKKLLFPLALLLALTACADTQTALSVDFFAMDTYLSLSATGTQADHVLTDAQALVDALEQDISRTITDSEIDRLNQADGDVVTVSDDTYDMLALALDCAIATDGAFDPTLCAITDLWGIGTDDACLPDDADIQKALATVGYQNLILLGDNQVQLLDGAQVDLGGIGKGYATDALVALYDEYDILRGVLSLGGNVYLYGEKADGALWTVGVTDPNDPTALAMTLQTSATSVVTTGGYERYFEQDGVRYHHIFDASTGYPADSDLLSVTVVDDSSTRADLYATALFVMGYDEAVDFATQNDLTVILIRDDDSVYLTPSIADNVTLEAAYEN